MKKFSLALIVIILAIVSTFSGFVVQGGNEPTVQPEVKTLSDLGSPTIAGTGAYYDDGMLKYASSGNTIGYRYDQSASVVEFDIIFDYLHFPGWFSLTFKASGFDRTQSANLTQKGYSIIIKPSGAVEVLKTGLSGVSGQIAGLSIGVKYRFKVGVYNENSATRIFLSVNGTEIVNAVDNTGDPYLTGDWFNICGDGGTSARLFSTKKEVVPDYYTYTLSTMGDYPTATASGVSYDKYKNIELSSGTVGWGQALRDFSLETKMTWERFGAGANVWVSLRANTFDRASSQNAGYTIRIGRVGAIDIRKNGALVAGGGWSFSLNTDYVFEFGCVDLDENRTLVFVNLNGMPVASFVDSDNPLRRSGYVNFNGDGDVLCRMTSVDTKLTPLKTKLIETETEYVLETYFNNTMSYFDISYGDFSEVLLDAILINETSVKDINNVYYALSGSDKINAVDLEYVNNKLVIKIEKTIFSKSSDAQSTFTFSELCLKKTGDGKGLICPSGYRLKQTYYYNV